MLARRWRRRVARLTIGAAPAGMLFVALIATSLTAQAQHTGGQRTGGQHHGGHQHGGHQHGGHHHHGGGSWSGGNWNRGNWNGGGFRSGFGGSFGSGVWLGGTNLTVIGPGGFSSFGVGTVTPGWGWGGGYYPGNWASPGWGHAGWVGPGWGGGWNGAGWNTVGWGGGYPYYPYPYVLPPVQVPAGVMFGPRAASNFLFGPDLVSPAMAPTFNNFNIQAPVDVDGPLPQQLAPQQPAGNLPAVAGNIPRPAVAANRPLLPAPAASKVRKASPAERARAEKLIVVADEDFREQKYLEAVQRYRRAAQGAPDLAEAYFRQAQAEIALSRYESAVKSCKQGLAADPAWLAAGFRLQNLYGRNEAAKTAHLEKLAQEAAANPQDTDLRFLIGIELFLDGEFERSRKFFEQAAALNPGDDAHLIAFLRELDRRVPIARADNAAVDL